MNTERNKNQMHELFSDHLFSVSDLTTLIKQTLEGAFYGITVEGEISNFKAASSGHWYFQLSDTDSTLGAVMFKQKHWRLSYIPVDGDRVRVTGSISVYAKRGSYQIICDHIAKIGEGDILALLEERKREFAALGYFDKEHKQKLPTHAKKIGVVTSPTGAAIQDILQVLKRRDPTLDITVLPAPVQGVQAASVIAAQIRAANRLHLCDVIIVGRGGGSLEDLLPFSERVVVQAIFESTIPVVSAVGHETDWALSDFVADLRAPTPSAAAELVSQNRDEVLEILHHKLQSICRTINYKIALAKGKTALFSPARMREYFSRRLDQNRLLLDDVSNRMQQQIERLLYEAKNRHRVAEKELQALSPLAVINRGYAVVRRISDNHVITHAQELHQGDRISVRFASGSAEAITETVTEP
jgi:exodeoxyribonuclease VII large subunit